MNYFVEGLQGSGKSTLARKLAEKKGCTAVREGEYSPIELAWCAYVGVTEYREILSRYPDLSVEISEKSYQEDGRVVICYTKIKTDDRDFYRNVEQYEIYNGRTSFDEFSSVVLDRDRKWNTDDNVFECSLLQNTVEDMILYRCAADDEILAFYRLVREALDGKEYRIIYLRSNDIEGNLSVIRGERTDAEGNETWFSLMLEFFDGSPYAKNLGIHGEEALLDHFRHRQELELRILSEIFPDRSLILPSKQYLDSDY